MENNDKQLGDRIVDSLNTSTKHFVGIFGALVNKANKSLNGKTAKKIKLGLIIGGAIGVLVTLGLFVLAIYLFMNPMFNMDHFEGVNAGKLLGGMALFIVSGLLFGLSIRAVQAGFAVVVAGVGAEFVDVQDYCPKCKDRVDADEMFCNNCGENLRADKICECGQQNDYKDKFCRKCGKKLSE